MIVLCAKGSLHDVEDVSSVWSPSRHAIGKGPTTDVRWPMSVRINQETASKRRRFNREAD